MSRGDRIGGWLHDRLPPTLDGSVRLTSVHLTVIALVVAAALGSTAWWVLRAHGSGAVAPVAAPRSAETAFPLPQQTSPSGIGAGGPAEADPPVAAGAPALGGASVTGRVVVDVAGKVRDPGIATLPAGSRVVDAVRSAGGARRGVDLTGLNLARLLVDGEQILVGVPPASGVAASAAASPAPGASAQLVNINTADQVALETLPGVGPVTAQAIITWRTENGAFTSVDELLEVSGIGEVTLSEMAPFVTI